MFSPHKIIVKITDGETNALISVCSLAEFFRDNDDTFSERERAEAVELLIQFKPWLVGGGAAPLVKVTTDELVLAEPADEPDDVIDQRLFQRDRDRSRAGE